MKIAEIRALSDDELWTLSLQKRKNGNGTTDAYQAAKVIGERNGTITRHTNPRRPTTKRYSYNDDYMPYNKDNR